MRILDLYDDPSALVLRRILGPDVVQLPPKLASLQPEDDAQLAELPDRLFALVGTLGGERVRKYAMHDPAHLATSIFYFTQCGGQLPPDVRVKVAKNLIAGCAWYDTEPPELLQKTAFLGAALNTGLALTAAPAKLREERRKSQDADAGLRAAQMAGVKQAGEAVHAASAEEAWEALERFISGDESAEAVHDRLGGGYPSAFQDATKAADTRGSELGAQGGLSNDPRGQTPAKRFAVAAKTSAWESSGTFELLDLEAEPTVIVHYALPHRGLYPLDSVEQVKQASAYFVEYHREFTPDDRRCFAQCVAARAGDLGVKVAQAIENIAGDDYGPHIASELKGRIAALEGTGREGVYEVLLEKLASTPPIVMYDMLKQADEDSGIDNGYGRPVTGFKEPLSAVFGAPEKPIYSWAGRGHYVTEEILRSYAKLVPDMDKVLGKGWSQKFVEDPVKAFERLPDAKKIIVARLANGEAFRFI